MRESLKKLEGTIHDLIEQWETEYSEMIVRAVYLERFDVTGHGREPADLLKVRCIAEIRP